VRNFSGKASRKNFSREIFSRGVEIFKRLNAADWHGVLPEGNSWQGNAA